jgi:cytochrome c biogenesis protein CcdA
MPSLLPSLIAIAALDSLNPTAIALQVYLLSTPRPIPRSMAFIMGIFSAYWTSGLLVILGLGNLIQSVIANVGFSLSERLVYTLQLLIGLILLIVGLTLQTSRPVESVKHPKHLTITRTFLLGMSVTVLEIPTALPYFAAIEQIIRAKLDLFTITSILGLYNFIFVLPPIALLVIYIAFQRQRFVLDLIQRIHRSSVIYAPKILRVLLLGLGILLIVDSLAYALGYPFLNLSS